MKIKTITCHEVYNYGASLQEFALLKYLEALGHTTEAIHYKPYYLSNHFNLWSVSPKYNTFPVKYIYLLAKLPGRIKALKRKKVFDTFSKKYIKTGNSIYKTNEELKNNLPIADTYICGSDQIWNSFFENGKDPAFYLDFVPDDKLKISYAASFAIDSIEAYLKPFVKEKVSRIHHVSVRETSGVTILNELDIENVAQVLDPVFLLSAKYWKETFIKKIDEKFIFVYDFDSNSFIKEIAIKLQQEKGYKIYTVNKNIKYATNNYWLKGPEFFLSLIANAQFVITNSFHAVAFSLIFEKQFVVVNRQEAINTRMRDLLALFDLNHVLITKNNITDTLNLIDYKSIRHKKQEAILSSKAFLINAIKN
ncbi:polysaccharide pyruvyl transferase family protein [Lutibacter sp. A64]|uniref:polysaccharide pyruvyl transferase family protein n=1 Tax=Lutibacter sp. A64 TaxID=2918526 RepID=UPI001F06A1C3|nr:polysaccharide pyruvyl transferase family protein [Lutibacter sp. A64]UMB55466.1 polysaccharide pyruvyl transferase family protein [Lutibacter sp. A64]